MENIILYREKKNCCGCGACYNICPKQAIEMIPDEYGFMYPNINNDKCVNCGLCQKVCGYYKDSEEMNQKETLVAVSKNKELLRKSASGGVFAILAKHILSQNGVVFGCSMENERDILIPKHIKISSILELFKLQGSKYVQSFIGDTYKDVKKELNLDRLVMFSGTPCQVAGLRNYLGKKEYDNLLTVDIVCHGVPSAQFFQDYIKLLAKKIKGSIYNFEFRDKTKGLGLNAKIEYKKNDGSSHCKLLSSGSSSYYKLFLESEIYRENCYSCPYAGKNRPADLTIGDYWGIETEHPEYLSKNGGRIAINYGVSCIIVNNEAGKKLLEQASIDLILEPSLFEKAARENDQLKRPSQRGQHREKILEIYKDGGYEAIDKWYVKSLGLKFYIRKIWSILPNDLKRKVKKAIRLNKKH